MALIFSIFQARAHLFQQWSSNHRADLYLAIGTRKLSVQGDSGFIIKQVKGESALKEIATITYQTIIYKLIKSFLSIQFDHVSWMYNKHVDALVIWLQKFMFLERQLMWKWWPASQYIRFSSYWFMMSTIGKVPLFEEWINHPQLWLPRTWKIFLLLVVSSGSAGVLTRALSSTEAKEELCWIHDLLVERIRLAFLSACRGKDFIWMKRLEMLLRCRWPVCSARSLSTLRNRCLFKRPEIGDKHI